MATRSVTCWQLPLQQRDNKDKTKTSLLDCECHSWGFWSQGKRRESESQRAFEMSEPRSGGRRAFRNYRLGRANQGSKPGWMRPFTLGTTELGRMNNDIGVVFSFKKSQESNQPGKRTGGAVARAGCGGLRHAWRSPQQWHTTWGCEKTLDKGWTLAITVTPEQLTQNLWDGDKALMSLESCLCPSLPTSWVGLILAKRWESPAYEGPQAEEYNSCLPTE